MAGLPETQIGAFSPPLEGGGLLVVLEEQPGRERRRGRNGVAALDVRTLVSTDMVGRSAASQQASRRPWYRRLFSRREGGQSLLEMSMVLPLFLVLIVGVVEVADGLHSYITLIDAGRDGARLGSKNVASDAEIVNLVLRETETLRDPVDAGDITINYVTSDGVDAINVEVCSDRSLILGVPLVLPDSFRMCSDTTMRLLPTGS